MLKRLKKLISTSNSPVSTDPQHSFEEKQIAAAVLLAEAAASDEGFGDTERHAMLVALKRYFGLSNEEAEQLTDIGQRNQEEAIELFSFTRTIKDNFDHDERIEMIEMLWEVVLADGLLHAYEDQLLRRIGGLLYVDDRDRGAARKRVAARIQSAKNS